MGRVRVTTTVSTAGATLARRRERSGAVRGLHAATEYVLGQAQPVTPLQEGVLVASAATDVDPSALEGSVSFDTVYAARQHQELTWRHDPGRQAKYLEQPHQQSRTTVRDIIAAAVRRELR